MLLLALGERGPRLCARRVAVEEHARAHGPGVHLGKHLGNRRHPIGDFQGSPSYVTHAPAGYTPYTYPHPLVTDLDVNAGPDMVLMADGAAPALGYIDGSATSASTGQVSTTAGSSTGPTSCRPALATSSR